MYYDTYPSPLGQLFLTGKEGVLTGLFFSEVSVQGIQKTASGEFILVKNWLDSYFRGEEVKPEFAMKPEGTAFQRLIWELLLQIPYGQTRTYGDLAREAARILGTETMSAQAVGQAVGRNPISIIIPCHRVVGTGGKLTGYAGGLHRKQWLLEHEGKNQEEIR